MGHSGPRSGSGNRVPKSDFGAKLDLVLKALAMSRGRLALELGVDKSLVGRWVSGAVTPSAHNLASLTGLIAKKRPGFTMLDWDHDLAGLASRFGIDPNAMPVREAAVTVEGPVALSPRMVATARRETARRGTAYEGFFTSTRLAFTRPGEFLQDRILIRRHDGLLHMRWGNSAYEVSGCLLLLANQLHGILVDESDDSILFCLLNGVNMPQVDMLDGIFMAIAKDGAQTPGAAACLLEREGFLSGDVAADDAHYETLKQQSFLLQEKDVPAHVRAHIVRDTGPAAFAKGGDLMLSAPLARSLSRGSPGRLVQRKA